MMPSTIGNKLIKTMANYDYYMYDMTGYIGNGWFDQKVSPIL